MNKLSNFFLKPHQTVSNEFILQDSSIANDY